MNTGYEEGEICNRNGCAGTIETHPPENCSCHIAPPCHSCTSPRSYCTECGREEVDDIVVNDYVVNVDKQTGTYKFWGPRELDASKIDWTSHSHSSCSMIKRGVYPPSVTKAQVEEKIRGTFGGHFNSFGGGKFEYVAYTD